MVGAQSEMRAVFRSLNVPDASLARPEQMWVQRGLRLDRPPPPLPPPAATLRTLLAQLAAVRINPLDSVLERFTRSVLEIITSHDPRSD